MHLRTAPRTARTPRRRRAAAWLIASAFSALLLVSWLGGGATASGAGGLHRVPGDLPGLSLATRLGAAPAAMPMRITVGVTRPDTAGELALYREMYDPSSPLYHHFLTVAQFNARFGVRPATSAAVRRFLTGGGLKIISSSAGADMFTATGSVTQLDRLFHVSIGHYRFKGSSFYANNAAPSVPATLPIDAVAGLDTVHKLTLAKLSGHTLARADRRDAVAAGRRVIAHNAIRTRTLAPPTLPTLPTQPTSSTHTAQAGTEQVYTPQDLWGIYDDPGAASLTRADGTSDPATVAGTSAAAGQGQTVGIFGSGETASVIDQLRLFEQAEGLPKVPVRTIDTEGGSDADYGDNTGAIEWYLDSQASTGIAPDVSQLDLYFAKSIFDGDIAKSFDTWANDVYGPREMNASFGECEANPTNPLTGPLAQQPYGTELGDELEALAEPTLRQATMEGRTLFSSAGDTGSGCPEVVVPVAGAANGIANQPVPIVSYPCASAYDVCVGGTVLSSPGTSYPASAQRSAETSWTNGGGGTSYFIPAPGFQSKVANVSHTCYSTPDGSTVYAPGQAPQCRGVPDVSDLSGNSAGDGYFIYIDSKPSSEGGTSLSSPLMMGQWARIQSAAAASTQSAGGLGYADPTIYAQAASADTCTTAPCGGSYDSEFNDITASEDASDPAGIGTGVVNTSPPSTGIGTGNGAYMDGPGWDYASGWGSLKVASFMQAVDGSTQAAGAYAGVEAPVAKVCTAQMASPSGNATDPVDVSLGNVPGADITAATLTASGSAITATLTVPQLASGAAPYGSGIDFTVAWLSGTTVYSATASEDASGAFTYSDSADKTGSASGVVDTGKGLITITVPLKDVGSPAVGSLLEYPQAFSTLQTEALGFTTDSADNLVPDMTDLGHADSVGAGVVVGGVPNSSCANLVPAASGSGSSGGATGTGTSTSGTGATGTSGAAGPAATACLTARTLPVTHITRDTLTRTRLSLRGTAQAHCPARITAVGVALAQVLKVHHHSVCRFLTAAHHWTKAGSCTPRDYLRAKGTSRWTFTLNRRLTRGTYHLWERAEDNVHQRTHNTAAKYVWFTIR